MRTTINKITVSQGEQFLSTKMILSYDLTFIANPLLLLPEHIGSPAVIQNTN